MRAMSARNSAETMLTRLRIYLLACRMSSFQTSSESQEDCKERADRTSILLHIAFGLSTLILFYLTWKWQTMSQCDWRTLNILLASSTLGPVGIPSPTPSSQPALKPAGAEIWRFWSRVQPSRLARPSQPAGGCPLPSLPRPFLARKQLEQSGGALARLWIGLGVGVAGLGRGLGGGGVGVLGGWGVGGLGGWGVGGLGGWGVGGLGGWGVGGLGGWGVGGLGGWGVGGLGGWGVGGLGGWGVGGL